MIETCANTASQVFVGNVSLEAAANWISKHEKESDIDLMPLLPVSSEKSESLKPYLAEEEITLKQELRDPSQKKEEEDKQTKKEIEKSIMGKKVKKNGRSGQKEKKNPPTLTKEISQDSTSNAEIPDGVASMKDRVLCSHIDRGINLDKLSARLGSSESFKCEDCRGNVVDRRAKKGKVKQGKKGGINSKLDSKAIWICLECGHFSCGGVGLPTTPQSHAVRHAKQNHHPLVVHYENHLLLWCFLCNKLIPAEKTEDKHKEAFNEIVKMLKGQPGEDGSSVDVEEVWFGSGSVVSAIKSDYSTNNGPDGRAGFSIRGLVNMGNTCFFNSIMQNLLALNTLRDYFIKLDDSVGPLSGALRKIFLETSAESGVRSAINPRSLFGSLCTRAPQFKGYQQHDSHELLRCLLDGLSTEESNARKHTKSSQATITDPTFVDTVFGGKLSSTVSCLECGHSSTIYEPFLDLSLPVPTKKPPSKRIQHVTRGKKPKLPPKRSGKNLPRISREGNAQSRESTSGHLTAANSSGEVQSTAQPVEQAVPSSADSALPDSTDPNTIAVDMGFTADDFSAIEKPQNPEALGNVAEQSTSLDSSPWLDYVELNPVSETNEQSTSLDSFTWLDYIEPNPVSETDEIRADFGNEDVLQNDLALSITLDANIQSSLVDTVAAASLDDAEHRDVLDPLLLSQQESGFSQFEDQQNVKAQVNERDSPVDSLAEGVLQFDGNLGQSSYSSNQVCSRDANNPGRDDSNSSRVQDPEVMMQPNKEDASSSVEVSSAVISNEQDSLDFDGFGDLFNEPEVSCERNPSNHPVSEASGITKNGVVGTSSESDPDEVDNADAPVSVESCLAFFTKPELLSKDEHAWQCDNCSKVLQEQKNRSKNKSKMPISKSTSNGCGDETASGLLDVGKNCKNMQNTNGNLEKDVSDLADATSQPHDTEIFENEQTEINVINSHPQDTESQVISSCRGPPECSTFSDQHPNPSIGECDSDKAGSEVSDQDEGSSEILKVKRDATKSILINKTPSILTIHLKRFSQDARGRLSKLNGHVNFRETIDLKPYMDPRCRDEATSAYRLVGVVEHLGTMRGGHYVAYVRGPNSVWYHASDAYVRQASFEEVARCEAYILFYQGT